MAKRSTSARLDSCGERRRDVAGTRSRPGVASQETRSSGIANDGDSDRAKGGRTAFGCEHAFGLRADGFLLCYVARISANSPGCADLG